MNRFLQDIRLGGQQVITPVEGGEIYLFDKKTNQKLQTINRTNVPKEP